MHHDDDGHHNYDDYGHHNYDDDGHHNFDDNAHHTVYQVRCPCLCQLPNRNSRTGKKNVAKLPNRHHVKKTR